MAGYCEIDDLVMGDIPIPSYISAQKQIDDARDEIDSYIGYLYITPVDVAEGGPLSRPARLLLKRINSHLATGRMILALSSPEENKNLHAYGWRLVRDSLTALTGIADGSIVLEGAIPVPDQTVEPVATPLINNLDPESNVEAFYDRVANPNYFYFPPYRWSNPDRLVD